jgi:hypothetical protein
MPAESIKPLAAIQASKQALQAGIAEQQQQLARLQRDEFRAQAAEQRAVQHAALNADAIAVDGELDKIASAKLSDPDGQKLLESIRLRFPIAGDMLDERIARAGA